MTRRIRLISSIVGTIAIALILIQTIFQQSIAARINQSRINQSRINQSRINQSICIPIHSGLADPAENPALCYGQPTVLSRDKVTAIAVSASGETLVSATGQTLQIWDLGTQTLRSSWQAHDGWITDVAISANGDLLASASLDGTIKLWVQGELQKTLDSGRVTALKFSADDQTLASGSRMIRWLDGKVSPAGVELWDVATGRLIDRLGSGTITAIAFSPDGKWLAAGNQNTRLWNLKNRSPWRTLDSGSVTSLAFSPDSQRLVSGSSKIKIWGVAFGTLISDWEAVGSSVALSLDEALFVSTSGGTLHLWQFKPQKLLGSLRGSAFSRISLSFSPATNAILTGGSDGIRLWQPHVIC